MHTSNRKLLLRANALYLAAASLGGLAVLLYLPLMFVAGFVEAHGLALIMSVLLWQAPPVRYAHLTAAAVMALLGTCTLAFWDIVVTAGLAGGATVMTALFFAFAVLQLVAASGPRARAAVQA